MKKVLIIAQIIICGIGFSQDNYYRFNLQPKIGFFYSLGNSSIQEPSDYLHSITRMTSTINFFSGNYYFSKNWGINLNVPISMQIGTNSKTTSNMENFLKTYYNSNYYTSDYSMTQFHYQDNTFMISLGGVYRKVKNRWTYQFGLNVNGFKTPSTTVIYDLKEHGSNFYYSVVHKKNSKFMIGIEPSVLVSVRLNKRLGIFLQANYIMSPTKQKIEETWTNIFTREQVSHTVTNSDRIYHSIGMNLGLSIELGKLFE